MQHFQLKKKPFVKKMREEGKKWDVSSIEPAENIFEATGRKDEYMLYLCEHQSQDYF